MGASHFDRKKKKAIFVGNEESLGFVLRVRVGGGWVLPSHRGCRLGEYQESSEWQLVFLSAPAWQLLDTAQVLLYSYLGPDILFAPTSFTDLPRHSLETQ